MIKSFSDEEIHLADCLKNCYGDGRIYRDENGIFYEPNHIVHKLVNEAFPSIGLGELYEVSDIVGEETKEDL